MNQLLCLRSLWIFFAKTQHIMYHVKKLYLKTVRVQKLLWFRQLQKYMADLFKIWFLHLTPLTTKNSLVNPKISLHLFCDSGSELDQCTSKLLCKIYTHRIYYTFHWTIFLCIPWKVFRKTIIQVIV